MKRFSAILFLAACAWTQVATNANKQYQTHEGREAVAKGLADPARDERQKPRELIEAMEIKPGMAVADVGTGVGYMIPFLSRAVGPNGKVYAEDIQTDFLDKAKQRAKLSNVANATFILGTPENANLPADTLNAILVLDVYHHFDYPDQMLAGLHDSLLNGGRIYIVDYYRNEKAMPNGRALEHIRLDRDAVIDEVQANRFRLAWKRDHIADVQYILAFDKK
ncbi:MAG: methyltransferase domain-containing protein [Acidobacteriaceae bacterium]|nr:methyltransferase domain-containing protein [Acidobacteriaceae bacterium]